MEKINTIIQYFYGSLLFLISTPAHIFAACNPSDEECVDIQFKLDNPIKVDNIQDFIKEILNIVLMIGIPVITLAIIYAGYLFISAQGNEEKLSKAKTTLLYTIIGAAILLGSWVLAQAIGGTINKLK